MRSASARFRAEGKRTDLSKRAVLARLATSRPHEFLTERSELLGLEVLEAAKRATKEFFQSLGDSPLEGNHRALTSQYLRLRI